MSSTGSFSGRREDAALLRTRAQAVDAAEAVVVDDEPLPVLIDLETSRAGTPLLHQAAGTNVSFEWAMKQPAEDSFRACDVVVDGGAGSFAFGACVTPSRSTRSV